MVATICRGKRKGIEASGPTQVLAETLKRHKNVFTDKRSPAKMFLGIS